ncbi:uncharacterized protein LOC103523009, partial [Diaphorina citri]|uniref:Uncharacterized protein LOC103523009 n=1 Tax=Diaphorina citri TaxID=121845 RepID=A0A1S3DQP6_DIACI
MLELIKDDQKEPLVSNLVTHIITSITRKVPDVILSESGNQVLRDTLRVLACEELYTLSSKATSRDDEDETEEIRKLIENANINKSSKTKEQDDICAPLVMETLGCCIKNIENKSKVFSIVEQIKEDI